MLMRHESYGGGVKMFSQTEIYSFYLTTDTGALHQMQQQYYSQ